MRKRSACPRDYLYSKHLLCFFSCVSDIQSAIKSHKFFLPNVSDMLPNLLHVYCFDFIKAMALRSEFLRQVTLQLLELAFFYISLTLLNWTS